MQRSRGTQGFGLFDGQGRHLIRSATEDRILSWLCKYDSSLIMFHHRFPTSTINVSQAAHPMSTKHYFKNVQYILVHNGIIRNAEALFIKHHELGIEYQTLLKDLTFNDSEALLWDFALTMEGKQKEMTTRGDMAFVCLKLVKGKLTQMYFGRNGRPLNLYQDKNTIELSSEGRGEPILVDRLYTWAYKDCKLTEDPMKFDNYTYHYNPMPYSSNVCNNSWNYLEPNEYDDYDTWHRQHVDSKWERAREKFGKYLTTGEVTVDDVRTPKLFEATNTGTGIVPNTSLLNTPKLDVDDMMEHKEDFLPTGSETQVMAMEYLAMANGVFEDAYAQLEEDYAEQLVGGGQETFEGIRKQLLMEKAMEYIETDPEYENEKSISSIWRALWNQQLIAM